MTRRANSLRFAETQDALNLKEVRKWVHYFRTQLRVGYEMEKAGYASFQDVERAVRPTNSYDRLSRYNVVRVVSDGSVQGSGIEVLVIGANEDSLTLHGKLTRLQEVFTQFGLKAHKSCGQHYHLIASQADEIPQIILKNFYQLVRANYAGLLSMTSVGNGTSARTSYITRSRGMEYANPQHMRVSPIGRDMGEVLRMQRGRYVAFNMQTRGDRSQTFGGNGNATDFHLELRFPDSSDAPAQTLALDRLFRAMVIKAAELSLRGVIQVDADRETWEKTKSVAEALQSATDIGPDEFEFAIEQAQALVDLVAEHVDDVALPILRSVAKSPVWKMRRNWGNSWARVEQELLPRDQAMEALETRILEAAVVHEFMGVRTETEWQEQLAEAIRAEQDDIRKAVSRLKRAKKLEFDRRRGDYRTRW